jgi:hypothetical protein
LKIIFTGFVIIFRPEIEYMPAEPVRTQIVLVEILQKLNNCLDVPGLQVIVGKPRRSGKTGSADLVIGKFRL